MYPITNLNLLLYDTFEKWKGPCCSIFPTTLYTTLGNNWCHCWVIVSYSLLPFRIWNSNLSRIDPLEVHLHFFYWATSSLTSMISQSLAFYDTCEKWKGPCCSIFPTTLHTTLGNDWCHCWVIGSINISDTTPLVSIRDKSIDASSSEICFCNIIRCSSILSFESRGGLNVALKGGEMSAKWVIIDVLMSDKFTCY